VTSTKTRRSASSTTLGSFRRDRVPCKMLSELITPPLT
jgi:hypothetical protein